MKKSITIVLVLVVLGLGAFRLANNKKEIDSKKVVKNEADNKVAVNVTLVESKISSRNLNLIGTISAIKEIDVKSEVQGKILNLNVELGDYVVKGKVIARIDDKIRSLSLANAEQKLADAKQSLDRYRNLYEGGAASKAQLDQYQLAHENAEIQLSQAKKELSTTSVIAPISGFITQKAVEAGVFANIGNSIVTIVDVSKLKVKLNVPEKDVYTLNIGDPVGITAAVYPGISFEGKITFISSKGDDSHNYPIEISLVNQDKNPLKAGTYVNIQFSKESTSPSLQIPREALLGSIKNAQVYVVDSQNVAHLKPITISGENGAYVEVLNGLNEGEKVVLTGQINLSDNAMVTIIQ